ncbi:MAG: hypothetical protein J5720_02470 [Bacteroidaceae bacterium]|nr:hypothetical protein [Bacteroidaceae bacterium]
MRIAANKVIIDENTYTNHVVELEEHRLLCHYPLTEEIPHTQWYRTIIIEKGQLVHTQRP